MKVYLMQGGIGFAIFIFISDPGFNDPTITDEAKIGMYVASFLAAELGCPVLIWSLPKKLLYEDE